MDDHGVVGVNKSCVNMGGFAQPSFVLFNACQYLLDVCSQGWSVTEPSERDAVLTCVRTVGNGVFDLEVS